MLVLSNEQIEEMIRMEDVLIVLEELYRDIAAGAALNSPRIDNLAPTVRADAYYGFKHMGGTWPRRGVQALRINSDIITHPAVEGRRRRVKVPSAGGRWVGLVELFSTETGELLAIFPDGIIQRMRVGATNGLAAKYLSRAASTSVGLIGAGWQAGTQLMAVTAVRPIESVKVYSLRPESRQAFAEEYTAKLGIPVVAVDNPEDCVRNVDILLAATSSMVPVLRPEWLKPGMHISCIKTQEVDRAVLERCDITVVHTSRQTKQYDNIMPGTPNILGEHLQGWWNEEGMNWESFADLAALVGGKINGRSADHQITCFVNNVGMGLQFAAAGAVILDKARKLGAGTELPATWFTESVHP